MWELLSFYIYANKEIVKKLQSFRQFQSFMALFCTLIHNKIAEALYWNFKISWIC